MQLPDPNEIFQKLTQLHEGPSLDFKKQMWGLANEEFAKDVASLFNTPVSNSADPFPGFGFLVVGFKEGRTYELKDIANFDDKVWIDKLLACLEVCPLVNFHVLQNKTLLVVVPKPAGGPAVFKKAIVDSKGHVVFGPGLFQQLAEILRFSYKVFLHLL